MKRLDIPTDIDRNAAKKSAKFSKTESGATPVVHCSMTLLAQYYQPLVDALTRHEVEQVMQYSYDIFKTFVMVATDGEHDKYHHVVPNHYRMALFGDTYSDPLRRAYSDKKILELHKLLVKLILQSVTSGNYERLNYLLRNLPPQYEWHSIFIEEYMTASNSNDQSEETTDPHFAIDELEDIIVVDPCHALNMQLIDAVTHQDYEECERLIASGANVNMTRLLSDEPNSPLQIACDQNNLPICLLLLQNGATAYSADCNGMTALHYAIHSGEICKLLIAYGADVNAMDMNSQTPVARLVDAIFNGWHTEGSVEAVKVLMDHGADANYTMVNNNNFTPITFLLDSYQQEIEEIEFNSDEVEIHRKFSEIMLPYAMTIPDTDFRANTGNNESSFSTVTSTLCSLKRFGIFKDLGHKILASDTFFRNHIFNILLPRIRYHAENNTLSLALIGVPVTFHTLVCEILCEYTINSHKNGPYKVDAIRSVFGENFFLNIARRLGASCAVNHRLPDCIPR